MLIGVRSVKYVPSWFPGASWKRKAATWLSETRAMADVPFEMAQEDAVGWSRGRMSGC